MPPFDRGKAALLERDELVSWQRARELQKTLYDGGFAGICFPREYGGLGLGYEYKKAFDAEAARLRNAVDPQRAVLRHLLRNHPRHGQRGTETRPYPGGAARRGSAGAAAVGTQRWLGPRGRHHPRRPPGRPMDHQRRQDVEHLGVRRGLRTMPGPDQLGRTETRGADDVPGAASASGNHDQPHPTGQRLHRILRRVLRRRRRGR